MTNKEAIARLVERVQELETENDNLKIFLQEKQDLLLDCIRKRKNTKDKGL